MKARFCSQCGEEAVVCADDGREREACTSGEARIGASRGYVVPAIGFAELGETIQEAALRELREEAGIEGEVIVLLDADSFESGHYGDLLIVSFEVEKIGGMETAGDDAVDVGYFPLDGLPLLAFPSIYDYAREAGVWERPADLYRVVELVSLMGSFFDRAFYHAAVGFEETSVRLQD